MNNSWNNFFSLVAVALFASAVGRYYSSTETDSDAVIIQPSKVKETSLVVTDDKVLFIDGNEIGSIKNVAFCEASVKKVAQQYRKDNSFDVVERLQDNYSLICSQPAIEGE